MKNLYSFVVLALLVLFMGDSNSQDLYTFDWNAPRVNINGHPHFKVNYYPGTTNSNYKGDFYPDLESNPTIKKYTFSNNCTLTASTDYSTAGLFTTPMNTVDNPFGTITDINTTLIVPFGVTVTFSGRVELIPSLLIKGRVVLEPSVANSYYFVMKTIIFPTGVFESIPIATSNHTVFLQGAYSTSPFIWDPLYTSSFLCLGGTVSLKGFNSESVWTGRNSSYSSYGGSFLRTPFIYNNTGAPIFRMASTGRDSSNNNNYVINNYYTGYRAGGSNGFISDSASFNGGGYLLVNPWNKNLWISGSKLSSMVFTLNSNVNIQNCVLFDLGHTKGDILDDNILDSNNMVTHTGTNLPDRYPITLLHNTKAVTISNNFFHHGFTFGGTQASIPRSFIGVKRSFGTISGNAFALKSSISGISLLHGTEQFEISYNAFLSVYSDTTDISSYRAYPDIDYLNGGIITTSPYSTYEGNAFEGNFKGGAFQVIPIQSRSSATGLSSDILIGAYVGLTQDNTADYKTNNVWNNVEYKNNFFAGEAEFRFRYSFTSLPTIKVNMKFGWYIGQRVSQRLGTTGNQANIELCYDSPYIASTLSIGDNFYITTSNSHNGKYNAVSMVNSLATSTYKYFAETFTSNYLSIKDSKFSHFAASPSTFLKNYATQLYFSNVNGTKLNIGFAINSFQPLYNLSPISTDVSSNRINVSFIPNFDFSYSDGQKVDYIVDGNVQSTLSFSLDPNKALKYNEVLFPKANGVYSVLISSVQNIPTFISPYGPYFANSYIIDSTAINFYLGIDLTSDISSSATALSIFGNSWTKCGWVSSICKTTGKFSKVSPTPSTVTESVTGAVRSIANEVSMLTSYLANDDTLGIKSSVNITLPSGSSFKFFIYSYNADYTGANIVNSLPLFTIKINGKYQEPYSRPSSTYQQYKKYGPFFYNTDSTDTKLIIEWASDNIKYSIPICGIEIFSNISSPLVIPTPTPSSGGAVETSSKSTTSSGSTETNYDEGLNAASSVLSSKTLFYLIFFYFIIYFFL
ncbi:hypothetical protein DDB_G0269850 [Dictyostelium discoideum AX4]|uniref:Uncharacterized protein n=1 Tax=Dictyostelium discoideum TaxID=44689 RepID=Q55CZ0_DICDI|nr:hypothetical protein DDB_G0269850 [Dictyostelium discoideum AX4]EAL72275.1 hypothetical protein DDB_G0269850 [Dictyostelium discoideum AX4]|eukprot:XP_646341.1 hypothetical protein DDB_G0269850 [Dictyostelium discoideum AX4]